MAFLSKNLSVLAYANGFTLWHYTSDDAANVVDTQGYFNPASEMLRVNDRIMATVNLAGSAEHGDFVVLSNSDGVVDVGDLFAIASVDTD